MRRISILVWVSMLLAESGLAQFGGPAFDKDYYVPEKGTDIDVAVNRRWDSLGWDLLNFGPAPGQTEDRIGFLGYASNPNNHTLFSTHPPFLVNNLKVLQETNVKFRNGRTIFGHFHSTEVVDALVYDGVWNIVPVIYWADENGQFDSSRKTYLRPSANRISLTEIVTPYVDRFTEDSLEDIILGGEVDTSQGDAFVLMYIGGSRLLQQDTVYQDTLLVYGKTLTPALDDNRRFGTIADFRGTGRKDFLASDFYGNWFYYKNDPPFTLEKFIASLNEDTLLTTWENPHLNEKGYYYTANRFTMRALPRPAWDKSVDFMPGLKTDDWRDKAIAIFRGGPHFGSNRLTLDSAEMYIRSPGLIDGSWSGLTGLEPYGDLGDMTGTGNPVMAAIGAFGHFPSYTFFYTLGYAIDEKVDAVIENPLSAFSGQFVSLNADGDKYRDALFGLYWRTSDTQPLFGRGELWLLHGTNRIPAKLNPNYAVGQTWECGNGISISPNPAHDKITLSYRVNIPGIARLVLHDILGRAVWEHQFYSDKEGAVEVVLPALPEGTYILSLQRGSDLFSSQFVIH